jgi:hypothetical protein
LIKRCVEHKKAKRLSAREVLSVLSDLVEKWEDDFSAKCPEELLAIDSPYSWSMFGLISIALLVVFGLEYLSRSNSSSLIYFKGVSTILLLDILKAFLISVVIFRAGVGLGRLLPQKQSVIINV